MFIDDGQLKQKLADMLNYDVSALPARMSSIVTDSNLAAYNGIVSAFIARGFTSSQVNAWDRGVEFQTDIALFWCLTKGGGLVGYDSTVIEKLDRRDELKTIELPAGGNHQEQAGTPKAVGYGSVNQQGFRFTPHTQF